MRLGHEVVEESVKILNLVQAVTWLMAENFTLPWLVRPRLTLHLCSEFFEQTGFVVQIDWRLQLDGHLPGLRSPPPSYRDWPTHRLIHKPTHEIENTNRISHIACKFSRLPLVSTGFDSSPATPALSKASSCGPFFIFAEADSLDSLDLLGARTLLLPPALGRTARVGAG